MYYTLKEYQSQPTHFKHLHAPMIAVLWAKKKTVKPQSSEPQTLPMTGAPQKTAPLISIGAVSSSCRTKQRNCIAANFSLAYASRTAAIIGKIRKPCSNRVITLRIAFRGITDVPARALVPSVSRAYGSNLSNSAAVLFSSGVRAVRLSVRLY